MKPNTGKALKPLEVTIDDLKIHWSKPEISATGLQEVPVAKLVICPKAFQMRKVDPKSRTGVADQAHLATLRDRLKTEGALDPIEVLPISYGRFVVFNGFHRAHAYKLEGRTTIPATVFAGTPSEAKMAAIKENNKVKKELTTQEKTEYLWGMLCKRPVDTLTGKPWTIAECAKAAKCSLSKAEKMEKRRKQLIADNQPVPELYSDVIRALHSRDDSASVSKAVRELGEQLQAILGPMDTPGKIKRVAKALQFATQNAGQLAAHLTIETGEESDLDEHNAAVREEARGEWQAETGELVDSTRARMVQIEQQMRDMKTRATIANFLFDASMYAPSPSAARWAADLSKDSRAGA